MRRSLVVLVVLTAGLGVADRVALGLAEGAVAAQLQASADLDERPDVSVAGFPFLTQALGGRYDRVRVSAGDLPVRAGVRVAELRADLVGVEVPLGDALRGQVLRVPVQSLSATALVPYADLSRQSGGRRLTVAPSGDRLAVTGSLVVLGRRLSVTAVSAVRLVGSAVVLRAEELRVGNQVADDVVTAAVGDRLDLRVQVPELPYGLRLTGLSVGADGLRLTARGTATVLTAR